MMSAPPTPPSELLSFKDSRFKPVYTPCERADSYRPSGFYPVHFGDVLDRRYRIVRKLGYGSSSTVWLAADSESQAYVALKIHAANVDVSGELSIQKYLTANYSTDPNSRFVHLLLDSFVLEGPNGKHTCFVTEPTGPSVSVFLTAPSGSDDPFASRRFPTSRTKSFLKDILAGLQFLHGNNVVHGDLQSGNLLFSLRNLNSLDRGGLEQDETNSKLDPLIRIDGKTDLWAPRYLVAPKPLADEALPQEQQTVQLADLGGAFWADQPPATVRTPLALRAPETILHTGTSPAIDIWSFGCLMFELITDAPLFELFSFGLQKDTIDDEHLIQLTEVIGPLPIDLQANWPRYSSYFGTDGERLSARPLDFDESKVGRSIKARPKPVDWEPPPPLGSMEARFQEVRPDDVGDAETEEIMALLREIFRIEPLERPSAAELLTRSWFSG